MWNIPGRLQHILEKRDTWPSHIFWRLEFHQQCGSRCGPDKWAERKLSKLTTYSIFCIIQYGIVFSYELVIHTIHNLFYYCCQCPFCNSMNGQLKQCASLTVHWPVSLNKQLITASLNYVHVWFDQLDCKCNRSINRSIMTSGFKALHEYILVNMYKAVAICLLVHALQLDASVFRYNWSLLLYPIRHFSNVLSQLMQRLLDSGQKYASPLTNTFFMSSLTLRFSKKEVLDSIFPA